MMKYRYGLILTLFLTSAAVCAPWQKTDIPQLEIQAEQGDAEAQYALGMIYMGRERTPEEMEKAVEYFNAAREKRHPGAMYVLGNLYLEGVHLRRNYRYGRWLIQGSCRGGYRFACSEIKHLPEKQPDY
ncbi:tetratricopeptide repeat protein [Morganella morganii]|uniref:Sel1 repeat family protein n=1 Tax=bacterium 19GA11TI05 TaxID=2920688 RepID=A0AAU6TTC1_UNCXX|nr:hypothetical protein [Morganella morganii]MDW7794673.1 hypothetical protein [Morganella morganii]HDS3819040.1 sel1 repeat family protein [Morganella morganii subsp. morganii]